jgi:hypothetical protein
MVASARNHKMFTGPCARRLAVCSPVAVGRLVVGGAGEGDGEGRGEGLGDGEGRGEGLGEGEGRGEGLGEGAAGDGDGGVVLGMLHWPEGSPPDRSCVPVGHL